MLARYFAMARSQIEAHGGVVEKFIGDAVVGVFGIPATHEDDPERAVRAALRICRRAADLPALGGAPLRLRVGINTGEALVRLGIEPGAGDRFITGDTVNTASRIQSVAPEMGVAVGPATYEATKRTFDYEELPPASLKGKAEPVRVFHPLAPRARLGIDLTRAQRQPFVGRDDELAHAHRRCSMQRSRALAPVRDHRRACPGSEEPARRGAARVRRCAADARHVATGPLPPVWRRHLVLGPRRDRQGARRDPRVGPARRDRQARRGPAAHDERAWFRERLLPLLGVGSGRRAERAEQFTAWRRFLEHLAGSVRPFSSSRTCTGPMRRCSPSSRDRRAGGRGAPARPGDDPAGARRSPTRLPGRGRPLRIDLRPLPDDAASDWLERSSMPRPRPRAPRPDPGTRRGQPAVRRGVHPAAPRSRPPRSVATASPRLREGATLPVPDSIQALLAARLDALPPAGRQLLGDASVVGKVFWAGAVAAMGERSAAVDDALDGADQREFVRPVERSSMAGEREYAFWHVLARDVAFRRSRGRRATRHVAAALDRIQAGDRVEDVADVLAHHYSTALDLARATGEAERAELGHARFGSCRWPGSGQWGSTPTALGLLEARSLTPPGHPERAAAAVPMGRSERRRPLSGVDDALDEAVELARERGDVHAQVQAMLPLTFTWAELGDPRADDLPMELIQMLDPSGPSPELADAYGREASRAALDGQPEEAIALLDRAVAVADAAPFKRESEGLSFRALASGFRAYARSSIGERAALDDFREAIRMAIQAGNGKRVAILYHNLASPLASYEGPRAAVQLLREAIDFAAARGLRAASGYLMLELLLRLVETGEIDETVATIARLRPELEAGGSVRDLQFAVVHRGARPGASRRGGCSQGSAAVVERNRYESARHVQPRHRF